MFVPVGVAEFAVAQGAAETMVQQGTPGSTASAHYANLDFSREELAEAMSQAYAELTELISSSAFRAAYREMRALPPGERPRFVREVFLDSSERKRRGIHVASGILVQTSTFGDRRPTLFVVKKFLPEKFHAAWENVNITFDNEFADEDISRDPEVAWRKPLSVGMQNTLIAAGLESEVIPDVGADDPTWSIGLGESTIPKHSE